MPIKNIMGCARLRRLLPRQRIALGTHVIAVGGLIPAFLFVAPPSRWDHPALLVVVGVLAVIADRCEVALPGGVGFDGLIALMLLMVAVAGPLPAMEIVVVIWLANTLTRRKAPLRAGALSQLALFGWQGIAAALVLDRAGVHDPTAPGSLGWLLVAGAAIYTVGWAVGPAIYGPLWLGQPFRALVRAYVDMIPAGATMIILGAATVVLTGILGVLALAVFALIAILPQSFLTYAARTRPVARLDAATATSRYAHAIAQQLDFPRARHRHLTRVLAAAVRHPATGDALDYACAMLEDSNEANYDAQVVTEWFNGRGQPLGLSAEGIPQAARVVAVAQTWSALTARGTPELGHREALQDLRAVAGVRLDPAVVQAAEAVIGQELVSATEPAPEPRLHHLRIPARLRRALTASATPNELLGS